MENEYNNKSRKGFYHVPVRGLSIAVIVFGVICIGVGTTSLIIALTSQCSYRDYRYYNDYQQNDVTSPPPIVHMCQYYFTWSSPGIWSGLMFIASGIIGVLAAKRKTTCFIVSMMILSFLTTLVAPSGIALSILASLGKSWNQINNFPIVLHVMNGTVILSCLVVFILSWIKFGYACRAVCCNGRARCPTMGQSVQYQPLTNQPMMYAAPPSQFNGMGQQGDVPPFQQPAFNQANLQPIYLVQGNQVIGVLPQNLQQAGVPLAPGFSQPPPQTQQV